VALRDQHSPAMTPQRPPRAAEPARQRVPTHTTQVAATSPAAASRELQQHDLDPSAARAVVDAAGVRRGHVILEVGAGRGALTALLLAKDAVVHVIEKDPARCQLLNDRFRSEIAEQKLILHAGDASSVGPQFSGIWRALANPPFNLTANLIRGWLLEPRGDQPEAIDLVLQYEAARKLCGRDGMHTHSSILTRLTGKPWISLPLRRSDVVPPSRVDLCLWSWRKLNSSPPPPELRAIDRLLAIGFAGPHTVAEALRGVATGIQLRRQAAEHGWKAEMHPRELKPVAWRSLATLLAMCKKI
jgi:16S rRNA A1518/A1519 N6-dimethyltransferase RsmA/KsgA/DIM1 with predicted DNA glycosylase/AP lyase activity